VEVIPKWILEKYDGMVWSRFIWFSIGPVAGSSEQGNEPSGSITLWEILE
jgi:hypothetical protein